MPNIDREEREKARQERKKALAAQQVEAFEDELSGHELNIARRDAVPQDLRDPGWENARTEAEKAIETINVAIDTTLTEAE